MAEGPSSLIRSLSRVFGPPGVISKGGSEIPFNCPMCTSKGLNADTGFNLQVNPVKRVFKCWRCNYKGKLETLLTRYNISFAFRPENWERVVNEYLYGIPKESTSTISKVELPSECIVPPTTSFAYRYLMHRGVTDGAIRKYDIRMGTELLAGRIVFPIYMKGECVYYTTRSYEDYVLPHKWSPPGVKSDKILGYDLFKNAPIVNIAEGPISGVVAEGVATLGKNVSDKQIELLIELGCDEYRVVMDGDAFYDATLSVSRRLSRRGCKATVVVLPFRDDPASLGFVSLGRLRASPYDPLLAVEGLRR